MKELKKPKIVVITGAESTGKSQLTRQLGLHFSAPVRMEYAREYLEKSGPHYTYADVLHIAGIQRTQMEEATTLDADFVFFDTWLIITKVWMEVVFGNVPSWIPEMLSRSHVDLFLLCATDLPWEPDPLRENGGEMREKLTGIYRAHLDAYGFRYGIVSGSGEERFQNALQIIGQIV
ncbi:MAG: ATP-binding protein [Bacteroidota bacterium]|jgi:nicotinamide riboside kinase|nr:ATP-binding protein [Bacteroidota bacterium]NLS99028.1 ATP-binding protein [Bacteroidales bacterium]OQB80873.1 MAG: Trifunctional NAD biosynthesis/regulator protein NadR [Bacteroidetes bacterium ADurb.Bin123]HNZ68194.1 ATP-binding protein [Prolixibacteraceae bacterium]HOC85595.1 ATP-binding protein [Prolixibacteraceae bacterium]